MKNRKEEPEILLGREFEHIEGFYTNPSRKAEALFHIRVRKLHEDEKCTCDRTNLVTRRKPTCTYGLMMELNRRNSKQIEEEFATWYKL